MSAVVLPAASAAFTSTQVIFSNSTESAWAGGVADADPAAIMMEAVPPANISKECETEAISMSFYDGESTILQIHYYHDYSSEKARLCYWSGSFLTATCSRWCSTAPRCERSDRERE